MQFLDTWYIQPAETHIIARKACAGSTREHRAFAYYVQHTCTHSELAKYTRVLKHVSLHTHTRANERKRENKSFARAEPVSFSQGLHRSDSRLMFTRHSHSCVYARMRDREEKRERDKKSKSARRRRTPSFARESKKNFAERERARGRGREEDRNE